MTPQEYLQKLGLSDKEIKIYLTLLYRGKLSAAGLSRETKINRVTVYSSIKRLVDLGIISENISKNTTFFSLTELKNLDVLVKKPLREIEKKKILISEAVNEFSKIKNTRTNPVPKIRFIEESQIEEFLFTNIEKWQESIKGRDNVWWMLEDRTFLDHYKSFDEWYWKQNYVKYTKIRQISNFSQSEAKIITEIPELKEAIQFVEDLNITSSVWVGGDYLIMITTQQHPFYLVEIHDSTLAHNMREIFKKLWHDYGKGVK